MPKQNKIDDTIKAYQDAKKFKSKIIITLIIIATVLVASILTFIVVGANVDRICKAYEELSGKPADSKYQFGKRYITVTRNENGDYELEFSMSVAENDASLDGVSDTDPGVPDGGDSSNGPSTENGPDGPTPPGPDDFELTVIDFGDEIIFPAVGDPVEYQEINDPSNHGELPRSDKDVVTWEFPYRYISTTDNEKFKTMKNRANI